MGEKDECRYYKSHRRTIAFFEENISNLQIKISSNFEKVILVNLSENYILEADECQHKKDPLKIGKRHTM